MSCGISAVERALGPSRCSGRWRLLVWSQSVECHRLTLVCHARVVWGCTHAGLGLRSEAVEFSASDITSLAGKLVRVPSQSWGAGLFGAGLGGKEEPKPGIAPACNGRGPQSRLPAPGGQGHQWVDATRRARQMAPHWLRNAVPLPWACCPDQCAAPALGQVGTQGHRGCCCVVRGRKSNRPRHRCQP